MSGPKTSRYYVSPEVRAALEEMRRRQQRIAAAHAKLRRVKEESLVLLASCQRKTAFVAEYDAACGGESELQLAPKTDAMIVRCEALRDRSLAEPKGTLEELEAYADACDRERKALSRDMEALDTLVDTARAERKTAVGKHLEEAFSVSFLEIERGACDPKPVWKDQLLTLVEDRKVSFGVRSRAAELIRFLDTANEKQIATFEALLLIPLKKQAEKDRREYEACYEEYSALREQYEGLCQIAGDEPIITSCSKEGIAILKQALLQKSAEIAMDDEEGYVAEAIDLVMAEFYPVVGTRFVRSRSGKNFRHKIYRLEDGVVVNVTESSDGKITMEVGAADTCDRQPTEEETEMLLDAMARFCPDFKEIEARLAAYGVLPKRILMMPVCAAGAQVINVREYRTLGVTEAIEAVGRLRSSDQGYSDEEEARRIRSRVKKARSLRLGE